MELTHIVDFVERRRREPSARQARDPKPSVHRRADSTPVAASILTYVIPDQNPGLVDLFLAPTEDADPIETRYTVSYFLKSGAKYAETWRVPRTGPITISQARSTA